MPIQVRRSESLKPVKSMCRNLWSYLRLQSFEIKPRGFRGGSYIESFRVFGFYL